MKQLNPARSILALLLFLAPAAGTSQTAFLVRDINVGRFSGGNSYPEQFHAALGKVFFTAWEPRSSWGGLWVTDGTDSGTRLLACPGACSPAWDIIGAVPGALLAAATSYGREPLLWRTDGTAPGTFPLTGPELGVELATDDHREETNRLLHEGRVYFSGCEPVFGGACGLWKTDGTIAGTILVELTGAQPTALTELGSRFAFRAGEALWISDGTPEGTSVVQTFPGRSIEETAAAGGKLFLFIREGFSSQELWISNGTEAGTRSVKSDVGGWLKTGERGVYFLAKGSSELNRLWFSDGTPGGTRLVTELDVFFPEQLEEVGGRAVFLSRDNSVNIQLWAATSDPHSSQLLVGPEEYIDNFLYKVGGRVLLFVEDENGRELWATEGTRAGTHQILDICPGACHGALTSHFYWPGGLLFTGRDEQNGDELWTTDGTAQGTRRLTALPDGYRVPVSISPKAALLGDKLLFGASSPYGEELWVSQGPDDTRLVTNIAGDGSGSDPQGLVPVADRIFFTACDDTGRKVWQSTGEREGTVSLGTPPGRACDLEGDLVAVGGQAFFLTEDGELWRTDGTSGGARRLATSVSGIAPLQDRLFFIAWNDGQAALWKTDGTQAGTVEVLGIPEAGELSGLSAAGSELYFAVRDQDFLGSHIWRSDGTPAGTRKIATVEDADVDGFLRAGPWVYFFEGQRHRIWRTNGTEAGTSPVVPLGNDYGDPGSLTGHGGLLYFLSDGTALWRSDGTAAGTLPVKTFAAAPYSNRLFSNVLTSFGGRLAFAAYDPVHGIEPWLSDGTSAGTVLLKDVFPGEESSWPEGFTAAGGKLFFAAEDDVHGSELWQSDGTEAGTRMVQDIAPFSQSSRPLDLTVAGNRLYFTADDGVTGRELWLLPLAEAGCTPSPDHLCLGNGRFRVEAVWRDFEGNQGTAKAVGLTADTGYFWFFSPTNVEVIVKVLDGTGLNGHRWVFYGALSSVEYTVTVTDTQTGLTRRYFNPIGQLASVADTTSFGPLGAFSRTPAVAEPTPAVLAEEKTVAAGPCQPTAERLCLRGGRFAVEVAWKDFQGNKGKGKAVNLTADTGYFWFFDAANVEVVLKVLDGTALNGKHWVFYGALSSVEYTITVTDTQKDVEKTYKNPSGRLASVADTGAF